MKLLFVLKADSVDGTLSCAVWIRSLLFQIDKNYDITVFSIETKNGAPRQITVLNDRTIPLVFTEAGDVSGSLSALFSEESFDAAVIFGTETGYTLSALKACDKAGMLDRTAVFAQGMARACAMHYAEGVPERIVRRWTLRDLLRRENIREEQRKLQKKALIEDESLRLTRAFIGRTAMDKAFLLSKNPSARYYQCNDVLRPCFYEGEWQRASCEKHRIFVSQYYYPLKGFHYLLEAAASLKEKYPDIKIAAAGYNPIEKSLTKKELKDSSYIRYIKSLIKQFRLEEHIELLGVLSDEEMKREYLRANVFVMPSTIENSPNSLAEAMMLGVPCIASDVGGVSDFAEHKKEAFVYPSSAVYLLSYYIDRVFDNAPEAERMASNGRKRALSEYDRERNIKTFEETMRSLAKKS